MIESIFDPPGINDYIDYFKTLLSVSGVLFGLAFTALIFVLQSGFASFKFSRRMFLELYSVFGRNLLFTLSYLTLIPLGIIYLGNHSRFLSVVYYLFSIILIKSLLDFYKHLGYIHTIFSTKFVPSRYGRFRKYFRYIKNLGFFPVLFLLIFLFIFTVYPVVISYRENHSFLLTIKGYFYSTLILLTFSMLRIVNFIPQFFTLSNKEIETKTEAQSTSDSSESSIDYTKEKSALREYLIKHGLGELSSFEPRGFLEGTLSVNFLDHVNSPEAWFNINVEVPNADIFEIRQAVCEYAYTLFKLLHTSMIDINSFVLSFHIKAGGEKSSRNIFFRTTRPEMDSLFSALNKDTVTTMMSLKNKLFDPLFRNTGRTET